MEQSREEKLGRQKVWGADSEDLPHRERVSQLKKQISHPDERVSRRQQQLRGLTLRVYL